MKKYIYSIFSIIFILYSCKQFNDTKNTNVELAKNQDSTIRIRESQKEDNEINQKVQFQQFLDHFNTDSVFQKQSVKFPLLCIQTGDFDGGSETKTWMEKESYSYLTLISPKTNITDEEVEIETVIKSKNSAIVNLKGVDTGLLIIYHFKKIDDKWMLVKIVDDSI